MKTARERFKKFIEDFYLVLVLVFLYAPILVMMVLSFNSSKSRSQWGGFTLKWYTQMFESATIMDALYNTLLIAFLSALIATILGTAAAIGLSAMKKLPRTICMGLNNIPMLNSDIVTGISLMLMFIAFGISLGFKTILFAHITFNVPYVMLSVMPKLKQTSRNTYEAAMDLGAGPLQAFFKVVFPDIMPGVLSGFLMAFTMSLDDFIITHFTRGAGINTLSTLIYSEVRRGIKPSMYALSTVIFVTILALLLITNFAPAKPQAKAGKEVIIRTLDIGADKQADYFKLKKEENPAMGYRAIRICLTRPEIFRTQLRAIYRASAFGKISIMFPMIASLWEVQKAKEIAASVRDELKEQGVPFGNVAIGIMIETPAAAIISEDLAKEVDFFSIGTNDLVQYTLAIDRQNEKLDEFYDPKHPAVLRLIRFVAESGHKYGCMVGICGELGAETDLTEDFLKMGIDELSVSPSFLLKVREKIRQTDLTK